MDSKTKRIENLMGKETSVTLKLVYEEGEWISPNGDGYSLQIYTLSNEAEWIERSECYKLGFVKKGYF